MVPVARAVAAMREHRDLLAQLLVWEIGKPWKLACADVDRCLDGDVDAVGVSYPLASTPAAVVGEWVKLGWSLTVRREC